MKKLALLILVALIANTGFSQQVDFNKVVVPTDFRAKTFEEFLVQLAWMNNPTNQIFDEEISIAKKEVSIKKWDWTDDLDALFNYNESHFIQDFIADEERDPIVNSLIYPRFNFGARISLGTLINNPKERQKAEIEVKIAELERDQEKLQIRAKVLEAYQDYLLANEILLTRKQAEEDASQTYQLVKQLFRKGEAKLDEVNGSSTTFFSAKESFITAKSEVKVAIIKIEELIGISFEEAKKYGPKEQK